MAPYLNIIGNPTPGAAAFDPATLGLHLWLDPSDLSTLWQNSAATTPVTTNNDPVGGWTNKGSWSAVYQTASGGSRGLYKTSGGLHWVLYDGTDDYHEGGLISNFITASEGDILIAAKVVSIATDVATNIYENDVLLGDNGQFMGIHLRSTSGSGLNAYNWDGNLDKAVESYSAGTAIVAHWRHQGGNLSIGKDNNSLVTVASGNTTSISNNNRIARTIGTSSVIAYTNMELYGIMARKTILDSTELANAKTWLGNKCGLSL